MHGPDVFMLLEMSTPYPDPEVEDSVFVKYEPLG